MEEKLRFLIDECDKEIKYRQMKFVFFFFELEKKAKEHKTTLIGVIISKRKKIIKYQF